MVARAAGVAVWLLRPPAMSKRLVLTWLSCLGLCVTGAPTHAQEVPQKAPAVVKAAAHAAPQPRTLTPKPAPQVRLAIETPTTRGSWAMRLTNEGDIPARVVADARLLTLEVTPRGARAPVRCELPDDMRPSGDLERALVVPPKRSYREAFEPRLYCFGAMLDALAPGAVLVARLGWITGSEDEPPFEVSPIEGVETDLLALKSIDALPVALPDEPTAWSPSSLAQPDLDPDTPRLSLRGPTSADAVLPNDISIPVTLRNDGLHAAVVRLRPEVLSFDVVGPGGAEHCGWPTMPAAALREMFTTLPPRGSETLDVTLSAYCTGHGLDQGGLFVLRPRLDTRKASGVTVGLRSFDGEVLATTPTLVRLHRGAALPKPLQRPQLEAP